MERRIKKIESRSNIDKLENDATRIHFKQENTIKLMAKVIINLVDEIYELHMQIEYENDTKAISDLADNL